MSTPSKTTTTTTSSSTTARPRSQFIQKLLTIVKAQEGIVWNDAGDNIVIQDPKSFSKEVLPRYFRSGNYASFVRQLHFYGFHKVDKTQDIFKHVKFRRDHPELARDIVRRTNGVSNDCNDKAMRLQVQSLTEELAEVKGQVGNMTNQIDSLSVLLKELYSDRIEMKKQIQEQKVYTQKLERLLLERQSKLSFPKPLMSMNNNNNMQLALPHSPQRLSDSKKRKRSRDQQGSFQFSYPYKSSDMYGTQKPKAISRSSSVSDTESMSASEDDIFFLEDLVDGEDDLDFDLTELMPPMALTREASLKLANKNNSNAQASALDEFTKNWPMEDIVKAGGNVEVEIAEDNCACAGPQLDNNRSCSSNAVACAGADSKADSAKFEQYKSCVQAFILAQLTSAQNTCNAMTSPAVPGMVPATNKQCSSGGFSETCCDVIDIIAEEGKACQNTIVTPGTDTSNNNASLSSITPAQMAQLSSVLVAALAPAMLECCKKQKVSSPQACKSGTC